MRGSNIGTIRKTRNQGDSMANLEKILQKMHEQPTGVRYDELKKVCEHFFGAARQSGTSHAVFSYALGG